MLLEDGGGGTVPPEVDELEGGRDGCDRVELVYGEVSGGVDVLEVEDEVLVCGEELLGVEDGDDSVQDVVDSPEDDDFECEYDEVT